jgi:hypothetical protein
MMLFLAALQQIPASSTRPRRSTMPSRWRSFWSITCRRSGAPWSSSVIYEIVAQFQLFGQSLLLTRGGPNNVAPIVLFIYETGLSRLESRLCRRGVGGAVPADGDRRDGAIYRLAPQGGLSMAMAQSQGIGGRSLGDRVILAAVILLAILWVVPVPGC